MNTSIEPNFFQWVFGKSSPSFLLKMITDVVGGTELGEARKLFGQNLFVRHSSVADCVSIENYFQKHYQIFYLYRNVSSYIKALKMRSSRGDVTAQLSCYGLSKSFYLI